MGDGVWLDHNLDAERLEVIAEDVELAHHPLGLTPHLEARPSSSASLVVGPLRALHCEMWVARNEGRCLRTDDPLGGCLPGSSAQSVSTWHLAYGVVAARHVARCPGVSSKAWNSIASRAGPCLEYRGAGLPIMKAEGTSYWAP